MNFLDLSKFNAQNSVISPLFDRGDGIAIQKSPETPHERTLLSSRMGLGAEKGEKTTGMNGHTEEGGL
jgi:hypothetical protein